MLQYLEKITNQSNNYWQINLEGTVVLIKFGVKGGVEESINLNTIDLESALELYQEKLIEKIDEGYIDPQQKIERSNFMSEVFEAYVEEQLFDKALDWLSIYGDLWIGDYEYQLLQGWLKAEQYALAERYILEKIKVAKDLNLMVRQIYHLSWTNLMLCRFMIGNLPPKPEPKFVKLYYENLALAQSKIGMFSAVETTLKIIPTDAIRILYLMNLLHTIHENTVSQMLVLDRALDLLGKINLLSVDKIVITQRLLASAEKLNAQEVVKSLKGLITLWEQDMK